MLLPLLRFALLLTLLLVLCEGRGSGSEKQEQNCCADNAGSFHLSVLLLSASAPLPLSSLVHHANQAQLGGLFKNDHLARGSVYRFLG
jgi:hypothetical protein